MSNPAPAKDPSKGLRQETIDLLSTRLKASGFRATHRLLLPLLCSLLRLRSMESLYQEVKGHQDPFAFTQALLQSMGIDYRLYQSAKQSLPAKGPLVIVANHPFGGLEALLITALLKDIRQDLRFMANSYLMAIPVFRDLLIPVNPFASPDAWQANLAGLRQALKWVHSGGALCLFPAGEVSHWQSSRHQVVDPEWDQTAIKLILKAQADVQPIYFPGANSQFFQYAGTLHPRLRTALLPSEFLKAKGQRFAIYLRSPISKELLAHLDYPQTVSWYIRARTYGFPTATAHSKGLCKLKAINGLLPYRSAKIAPARQKGQLLADIERLPPGQTLLESGEFKVLEAKARQIPNLLHEIGRQREITFRHEGEGSKRALDLDLFDQVYEHLILWDRKGQRLAGAYRLGRVDKLLALKGGIRNLYTSTLFHFQRQFFDQIDAAIELGRSFITPEYQKGYSPLLLLWKGIGQYIQKRPGYRYLFGPVSISQAYDSFCVQCLMTHLRCKFSRPDLADKVRGKRPPRLRFNDFELLAIESISNLATPDLNSFILDMQDGLKGMPVLLRQYLKIGGKIADFHHDRRFGSFDGLILVDLLETEYRILTKFMGQAQADHYLSIQRACRPKGPDRLSQSGA